MVSISSTLFSVCGSSDIELRPLTGTQFVFLAVSISPPIGVTPRELFPACTVFRRDLRLAFREVVVIVSIAIVLVFRDEGLKASAVHRPAHAIAMRIIERV